MHRVEMQCAVDNVRSRASSGSDSGYQLERRAARIAHSHDSPRGPRGIRNSCSRVAGTTEGQCMIENVSDTARWVAWYRAQESSRPDALFRDPFAARLAGPKGEAIAAGHSRHRRQPRDRRAHRCAGRMDPRAGQQSRCRRGPQSRGWPRFQATWRMSLPPALRWIDADLPGILSYKTDLLRDERPVCNYGAVLADLTQPAVAEALFARIGAAHQRVVVITEGLLIYLKAEQVSTLGRALSGRGIILLVADGSGEPSPAAVYRSVPRQRSCRTPRSSSGRPKAPGFSSRWAGRKRRSARRCERRDASDGPMQRDWIIPLRAHHVATEERRNRPHVWNRPVQTEPSVKKSVSLSTLASFVALSLGARAPASPSPM